MRGKYILAIIIVLVIVGGTALYFFSGFWAGQQSLDSAVGTNKPGAPSPTVVIPPRVPPQGSLEYHNTMYGISLFYPQDLSVKAVDEGQETATITFQNPADAKGFQIFVVPYSQPQVSQERFQQDVPSGVRTGVAAAVVDGATAATFYSKNATLGETFEVWFIRGGYLYEVTAPKEEASWLKSILQTWQFIP